MSRRKPRKPSREPELVRHDGGLCATFVNTASARRESIGSYADLLVWGQRNGAVGAAEAQRLARLAGERPAAAEAVFGQAREVRDWMERILRALVEHRSPDAADMELLNDALGPALAHRRLVPAAGSGYRWDWGAGHGDDLDRVLWPVLRSAAEVLSTKFHLKVGECGGEDCGLLFVDRTPGSPRKWCRVCGNRHRSSRHYHTRVKPKKKARKAAIQARLRGEKTAREPAAREPGDLQPLGKGVA